MWRELPTRIALALAFCCLPGLALAEDTPVPAEPEKPAPAVEAKQGEAAPAAATTEQKATASAPATAVEIKPAPAPAPAPAPVPAPVRIATVARHRPMFGNPSSVWGRVGIEYRLRPEVTDNNMNLSKADQSVIGFQRARLLGALNYAAWLKTTVEIQDARTVGYMNDSFDLGGNTSLHQAWVQISVADSFFELKVGRQQLSYGDERLIGPEDWSNAARAFDAIVTRFNHPFGKVDLFASFLSPDVHGNLKDLTTFFGAYSEATFLHSRLSWDLYLLGLFDTSSARPEGKMIGDRVDPGDPASAEYASPRRQIGTLGTRLRYKDAIVNTGIEAAYQFGYADERLEVDQNAVALHADIKMTVPVLTKPYVRVEGNFGSGDGTSTDGQSNTFVNLYPSNHGKYGAVDLASLQNAVNLGAGVGFQPSEHFGLAVDYWLHARTSVHDAWYNASGKPLSPADPSVATRYDDDYLLGHELDLIARMPVINHLRLEAGFSFFKSEGYAKSVRTDLMTWAYVMLAVNY